jgi:hypothetical protein
MWRREGNSATASAYQILIFCHLPPAQSVVINVAAITA